MLSENRILYYELKQEYPIFFEDKYEHLCIGRACGKTLMTILISMSRLYTEWFVYKLKNSNHSLTKDEYVKGLQAIEKIIYNN